MKTEATDPVTTFVDALERAQAARRTRAELLGVVSSLMAHDWKGTTPPIPCTKGSACNYHCVPDRPCRSCNSYTPTVEFAIQAADAIIAAVDKKAPTADTDNALALARAGLIAAAKDGFAQYLAAVSVSTGEFDDENHGSDDESKALAVPFVGRFTALDNGQLDLHADDQNHLGVELDGVVAVRHEADGRIVIMSPEAFVAR